MTLFPVAPVSGVIDTTAAGDSFNGSYIAALLSGLSASEAIGAAQQCAGQVIKQMGALIAFSELGIKKNLSDFIFKKRLKYQLLPNECRL